MTLAPEAVFRRVPAILGLLVLAGCGAPQPEPDPLGDARAALVRGDGLSAEIVLREMLANGTPRDQIAAYFGEAELAQGKLPEARDWLEGGKFAPGSRAHGFHMLGVLEMRTGNLPAAGTAFDRALESDPDDAALWADIGRLRYLGGEHTLAAKAGEHAVALDPSNPEALHFRGQLVRDAYGAAAALPWFEAALRASPDDIDLLADYAATLGESEQARQMLAVVRRMATLDPDDPRIYFMQATLAARAGDLDLARKVLAGKVGLDRLTPATALLSGIVDLHAGSQASAVQTFDWLVRNQPDNRRARRLLAYALHVSGNDRELVYRLGEAAMRDDAGPYLSAIVGRAYEALGERDKAAPLLERAARTGSARVAVMEAAIPLDIAQARGPTSGTAAVALIRGLIASNRTQAAIDAAEAFRLRFPGSGDALGLSGDALLAAGRTDDALERYRQAAAIRRPWPLTRRMLAALGARRDGIAAYLLLADQLRAEPANREAATMLALLACELDRSGECGMLTDHALVQGGARDPHLWALKAETASLREDAPAAREAAQRAYNLQRTNPLARRALAHALSVSGETDAARALTAP